MPSLTPQDNVDYQLDYNGLDTGIQSQVDDLNKALRQTRDDDKLVNDFLATIDNSVKNEISLRNLDDNIDNGIDVTAAIDEIFNTTIVPLNNLDGTTSNILLSELEGSNYEFQVTGGNPNPDGLVIDPNGQASSFGGSITLKNIGKLLNTSFLTSSNDLSTFKDYLIDNPLMLSFVKDLSLSVSKVETGESSDITSLGNSHVNMGNNITSIINGLNNTQNFLITPTSSPDSAESEKDTLISEYSSLKDSLFPIAKRNGIEPYIISQFKTNFNNAFNAVPATDRDGNFYLRVCRALNFISDLRDNNITELGNNINKFNFDFSVGANTRPGLDYKQVSIPASTNLTIETQKIDPPLPEGKYFVADIKSSNSPNSTFQPRTFKVVTSVDNQTGNIRQSVKYVLPGEVANIPADKFIVSPNNSTVLNDLFIGASDLRFNENGALNTVYNAMVNISTMPVANVD